MGSLIFLLKINKFHKLFKLRIKVPRVSLLDEYFTKSFPRPETLLHVIHPRKSFAIFPRWHSLVLLFFFKLRKQNWFTKECMRKNAGNIHKANGLVWHTGKEEDTVLGCYQLAKGTWHFWCCCTRSEFIWCADWHLLLQCYIIVVPQKFLLLCCGDGFKVVTLCWAFWWPHKSKGGIIHKSCHSFSQWRLKGTRHLHVANMFCVNGGRAT